jgi:hypothetical protein
LEPIWLSMRPIVRLCLLVLALGALFAQPAQASRALGLPETLTSEHFQIHYAGQVLPPGVSVIHQDAADLAANMEHAYSTIIGAWGYPAPLDDGDGKIDVFVVDLSAQGFLGLAWADNPSANQSSGYLYIDDNSVRDLRVAAHELFHLVQSALWVPMDSYVSEASAEWAAFRVLGFPLTVDMGDEEPVALAETVGAPDMSLTCSGSACGLTGYESDGYSRWNFYEYLTERYGGGAVLDLFQKAKSLNDPSLTGGDLLVAALQDKGSTLSDTFGDFTVTNLSGSYTAPGLTATLPAVYKLVPTGSATGALGTQTIAVNHLAARYLAFQRGTGASDGPCYAATLSITVTFPAGLGARPTYRWTAAGIPAVPLAVSGSTASITVPWDTCSWKDVGLLSLPNPTAAVDAAVFKVSAALTVDKSTFVTSTPPPAGTYTGPTILAPEGEEAPSISVYGPETLRVSRKKRLVRLVVFSSGMGSLRADLGGLALGSRTLRTGNNDLRFTLPKNVMRTLAARGSLTLTVVSPSGAVGVTVTRKILLTK